MLKKLQSFKTKISMLCKKTVWLIIYGLYFKYILKTKYKINRIKMFKFSDWHLGCNYFTGFSQKYQKEVFIKTSGRYKLAEREFDAINYVLKKDNRAKDYLPNIIEFDKDCKVPFIAIEFIEGITLNKYFEKSKLYNGLTKEKIIADLSILLEILHNSKVIHRDIRPDNIMLSSSLNNIFLIDFAFAISVDTEDLLETEIILSNPNILDNLGEEYKPRKFYWDDAYSINMIIEKIQPNYFKLFPDIHRNVSSKIGKLTHEFKGTHNE